LIRNVAAGLCCCGIPVRVISCCPRAEEAIELLS
jgi:hypothetical protein